MGSLQRTKNYFFQLRRSFLFKGAAAALSLIIVPLMIRYLGPEQYGVWSTLLSIMSWIVFFDLGIGNGLRNKLAESLAVGKTSDAVAYVSSGYTWIGLISLGVFVLLALASLIIPWQAVFNTRTLQEATLRDAVLVAAFFVLLNFWIGLINQVLNAVQKTSWVVFGQFMSNAFSLCAMIILGWATEASLLCLITAYGVSMVASNGLLSLAFYTQRRELIPRPSFEIRHINPLVSMGLQFFVVQIAVLVIFTTDKLLITQLFGAQYVTQYDVVFKLFGVITMVHGLVSAPLWSAYTDAYHNKDFAWVAATLRRQLAVFSVLILAIIALSLAAKPILVAWVGEEIEVPNLLIASMGVFTLISCWNNIFAFFLNGAGIIRVQLYTAVIAMLINIPLAIMLTRVLHFGLDGVVWSTCVSLTIFAVIGPIQVASVLGARKHSPVAVE